ncbi:MAG: universal stress protein [Acidimicrobiia bacterium]|nr:universal stress protein [Acidimicrobiia bacterium]
MASGIGQVATDRSVVFLPSQRGSRWLDEQSVGVTVVHTFSGLAMLYGPECHDPPIGTSVIVPLDGSRLAERAIEPAMAVATTSGAIVRLVTVMPAASIDAASELLLEGVVDSERRYLRRITSRYEEAPVDLRWETTSRDDPVAGIDAMAAEHGSSLIVAATHGDSNGERQLFGSVCMGLVEQGRVPVLIVTPGA